MFRTDRARGRLVPGAYEDEGIRDGDDWRLTGLKRWISFGSMADVALIRARTEGGIRGFLVEMGGRRILHTKNSKMASLRFSETSTLILEDGRVPEKSRLPKAESLKAPILCFDEGRLGIACYEKAWEYAGRRVQFGRPLAAFQLTQRKLVGTLTEVAKGRLRAPRVSRLRDEGRALLERSITGHSDFS